MIKEHIRFDVRVFRDVERNAYTQVTASCECGRGGWVRIPEQPAHKVDDTLTDLQPSDTEPSTGNSKAQTIRNLVDLYDEYNASATRPTNPSLRGFISYLRGQL